MFSVGNINTLLTSTAPVKQDLLTPSITLFQASDFQNGLTSGSKDKPDPRAIMVQLSNDFALTPKFIKDPTADTTAFKLMLFGRNIDDIENAKDEKLDPTATAAAVVKQLGQEHGKIIQVMIISSQSKQVE